MRLIHYPLRITDVAWIPDALYRLTGNAILRAAGHNGYASDAYTAVVGVIGGAISYSFFAFLNISISSVRTHEVGGVVVERKRLFLSWLFDFVRWMVFSFTTAAVGGAVLWSQRNRIGITGASDVPHSLAAGVLGATIYLPLVMPVLYRVLEITSEFIAEITRPVSKVLEEALSS